MPTYDYQCLVCSHEFETEKSIKDETPETCPKCKVSGAKRLISAGGSFVLKGGGWASENYGSSKPSS